MQKRRVLFGSLAIAATIVCAVIVTRADDASDAARLIETLGLQAGSTVGEIGAGDGELTILVARHVGPTGRVFTTELGDDRVRTLRAAVEKAGRGQRRQLSKPTPPGRIFRRDAATPSSCARSTITSAIRQR